MTNISQSVQSDIKNYIKACKVTRAGRFCFRFLGYRKSLVLANINQAFGAFLTEVEMVRLAQAFYSHLLTSIYENLALPFMSHARIKQKAEVIGVDKLKKALEQNKGAIILTGHFGNWEFGPIGGILNFSDFHGRLHFIRRQQSVEWIGKWLFRRYIKAGLRVITQQNSLAAVCDVLDNNNAVVFVMDQHPPMNSKDGIKVEFFGKKTGTYRSVATLARYTGVPVLPASTYRDTDGLHKLEFFDPLPWTDCDDPKRELEINTLAYNQALEKLIIAHPEQWLWLYKRWKKPRKGHATDRSNKDKGGNHRVRESR